MEAGNHAAARGLFVAAYEMVPENVDNLCELANCHVAIAGGYTKRDNQLAAVRELDRAIEYYNRAIMSYPGNTRALEGKNLTLELRGKYGQALSTAQWASKYVGPSAKQQIFLAKEYAERGDVDQALLAYKQALAMEPDNPATHWAIAYFYLDLGKQEQAIAHLQQAYQLDPNQTFVANELLRLGAKVPEVPQPE